MTVALTDTLVPDWVRHLTRPDLEELFGATTVRRGTAYQRKRAVRNLCRGPDGISLEATVQGGRRYTTVVSPDLSEEELEDHEAGDYLDVVSDCSCPMGEGCKHVVAVILEAQTRFGAASAGRAASQRAPLVLPTHDPTPAWEALLAPVLKASAPAKPAAGMRPLALLVDVSSASSVRPLTSHGKGSRLQLRPLVPGAAGGWIRTGISWSDVQYPAHWHRIDPVHRDALAAIVTAERIRSHGYYSTPRGSRTRRRIH